MVSGRVPGWFPEAGMAPGSVHACWTYVPTICVPFQEPIHMNCELVPKREVGALNLLVKVLPYHKTIRNKRQ